VGNTARADAAVVVRAGDAADDDDMTRLLLLLLPRHTSLMVSEAEVCWMKMCASPTRNCARSDLISRSICTSRNSILSVIDC
jgi:hypothetical protein